MEFPEFLGYEEILESFSFREVGGIRIPKAAREKAFSMQIDIEILSTDGNDYLNKKSLPAYGFYGYAVVVLRDHSEIQIPITLPRQSVYYERREEAYTNWYNLYLKAIDSQEKAFISEFQLKPIAEALGLTPAGSAFVCPLWSGFEEVRVREVYVKTRFGTRFQMEVSRWEPIPVTYGENCLYEGDSRQEDIEKDEGLPTEGVQPASNGDPLNPYDRFPPPSEEMELGDFSLSDKTATVDNVNPDNEPSPMGIKLCSGTVQTFTTAPENPTGVLASTFDFVDIPTSFDDSFTIESWSDPTSFTGFSYGVKMVPSGLWFTGAGFQTERLRWSQRDTRVFAECRIP